MDQQCLYSCVLTKLSRDKVSDADTVMWNKCFRHNAKHFAGFGAGFLGAPSFGSTSASTGTK